MDDYWLEQLRSLGQIQTTGTGRYHSGVPVIFPTSIYIEYEEHLLVAKIISSSPAPLSALGATFHLFQGTLLVLNMVQISDNEELAWTAKLYLLLISSAVGIFAALIIAIVPYSWASFRPKNFPPGPKPVPFLGNLNLIPASKSFALSVNSFRPPISPSS